ncbi:hypothetical protein F5878DRAFT_562243, partial [Lentinula raphanica]
MSQQSQHEGTSYGSLHSTHHPSAPSRFETQDVYGHAPDTDNDDTDTQGPPKKKRRRQALSCTECKRRKIKCDRNQPCAPCTRRGEQAKCQWHVVEPIEKYVSRAEYDELKLRFEHLENTVHRFMGINSGGFGSGSVSHGAPLVIPAAAGPDYQSGNQGPSTGYAGTTIGEQPGQSQSFSATARPTPPTHRSSTTFDIKKSPSQQMMPPPKLLNQSSTASTYEPLSAHHQQLQHEALGPGSPPLFSSRRSQTHARQRSRSSVGSASSMRSPMIPHSSGGTSATNSPAQQYRSLPNESPLLSAASPSIMKNSPLSLASITSPFDSEPGLLSRSGGVMPSDSEVPTSASPNTSSWIAQSRLPVSPTLNQPKNFYAQMSRLGERLRKFTLVFLLHHTPSTFTSTPLTLVMLHALMTRTSTPRFLRARFITAVLSVVKLTILIA